jgi:hypothetical protein
MVSNPDIDLLHLLYSSGMDVGLLNCSKLGSSEIVDFVDRCRTQPRTLVESSAVVVRHSLYMGTDGHCIVSSIDALQVPYIVKKILKFD